MAKVGQALVPQRKLPSQVRSKATVEAIIEAAAQILASRGEAAVSTKTVAARAGCSIGTLYQYFHDRDALLIALADRERERLVKRLRLNVGAKPTLDSTRAFIRALIRSFEGRRGARRQFELVAKWAAQNGKSLIGEAFVDALARRWADVNPDVAPKLVETHAFVLIFALGGVMRAAALQDSPLLKERAFEDALCQLVATLEPAGAGTLR